MLADEHVAGGQQLRAAMVVDHALRLAGGAGGVVERDGVPFVVRHAARRSRVARRQHRLVVLPAHGIGVRRLAGFRVGDLDHQRLRLALRQRQAEQGDEFAVDQDRLRLAMVEDIGDGRGIEPGVQRVQHGAGHRHAVMAFQHLRRVRQQRRHRVAAADAVRRQRRGEPHAAVAQRAVGPAQRAVDDRDMVREDRRRTFQEQQRRQRLVVGGVAGEPGLVVLRGHVVVPTDAAIPACAWPGRRRSPRRHPRPAGSLP